MDTRSICRGAFALNSIEKIPEMNLKKSKSKELFKRLLKRPNMKLNQLEMNHEFTDWWLVCHVWHSVAWSEYTLVIRPAGGCADCTVVQCCTHCTVRNWRTHSTERINIYISKEFYHLLYKR
jgi:hypothetical protein